MPAVEASTAKAVRPALAVPISGAAASSENQTPPPHADDTNILILSITKNAN
jgi:hypothetical protein